MTRGTRWRTAGLMATLVVLATLGNLLPNDAAAATRSLPSARHRSASVLQAAIRSSRGISPSAKAAPSSPSNSRQRVAPPSTAVAIGPNRMVNPSDSHAYLSPLAAVSPTAQANLLVASEMDVALTAALSSPDGGKTWALERAAVRATSISDRKSTRLNSSHANNSYAVFCLKKKKHINEVDLSLCM